MLKSFKFLCMFTEWLKKPFLIFLLISRSRRLLDSTGPWRQRPLFIKRTPVFVKNVAVSEVSTWLRSAWCKPLQVQPWLIRKARSEQRSQPEPAVQQAVQTTSVTSCVASCAESAVAGHVEEFRRQAVHVSHRPLFVNTTVRHIRAGRRLARLCRSKCVESRWSNCFATRAASFLLR